MLRAEVDRREAERALNGRRTCARAIAAARSL